MNKKLVEWIGRWADTPEKKKIAFTILAVVGFGLALFGADLLFVALDSLGNIDEVLLK